MRYGKFLWLNVFIFLSVLSFGQPANNDKPDLRLQRLKTLADIWGDLAIHHPFLVEKEYKWDSVLAAAIPQIEKSETREDFVTALNKTLFAFINDPLSYALTFEQCYDTSAPHINNIAPVAFKLNDKVGYLSVPPIFESDLIRQVYESVTAFGSIERLVVDLRAIRLDEYPVDWLGLWADKEMMLGPSVAPMSSFYAFFSWHVNDEGSIASWLDRKDELREMYPHVKTEDWQTIRIPTVFIVNLTSYPDLEGALDALQKQSNIAVVLDNSSPTRKERKPYPEKILVNINNFMPIANDGALGGLPDTILQNILITDLPILSESLLSNRSIPKKSRPQFNFKATSSGQPRGLLPLTREQKIMGLMKIWVCVKYYYAYPENIAMDWENMLLEWIPRVEGTDDMHDYYTVLRRATARLNDSHISFAGPTVPNVNYNKGITPRFLKIQGKVIAVYVDSAAGSLKVGDEVIAVDGSAVAEIEDRVRKIRSNSNEANHMRNLWEIGGGFSGKDSFVNLTILQGDKVKQISIKKTEPWQAFLASNVHYFGRKLVELLPGNIGYIRLYNLNSVSELDSALRQFKDTRGLIFDIRAIGGSRSITGRHLIDRLIKEPFEYKNITVTTHSIFWGHPLASKGNYNPYHFPSPDSSIICYYKPIVAIISARQQSAGEYTLQLLQAAKRVSFVGSPTAGTAGMSGGIRLPDGNLFRFTHQYKLTPDGSRFHGVGILPDVDVEPTIKGISAGRDEVLEKAIELLNKKIKMEKN